MSKIDYLFRQLSSAILKTSSGQQFIYNSTTIWHLLNDVPKTVIDKLRYRNLLVALTMDLFAGIFVGYLLFMWPLEQYCPDLITFINAVASNLQVLLHWLMGVPVGLKLNYQLNECLGHFFLYHIHLWKTYTNKALQPIILIIIKLIPLIGSFGLSFQLSVINDLISIATVHIYCFYGYATRLYGIQVSILFSLWRLFRGKKWNPLRRVVDSHEYNEHQLFIGTLIFTILLFLLPTVALYYFVFTLLRITVLVPAKIIARFTESIILIPWYVTFLYVFGVDTFPDGIHFETNVRDLTFPQSIRVKISKPSYVKLVTKAVPVNPKECTPFSWTNLAKSIMEGNLIYPI